jgi:hypothetical protein
LVEDRPRLTPVNPLLGVLVHSAVRLTPFDKAVVRGGKTLGMQQGDLGELARL